MCAHPCVIQHNGNRMREFSKLDNTASKQPGSLYHGIRDFLISFHVLAEKIISGDIG